MRHSEILRQTIAVGRLHGFVKFDRLNELMSSTATAPEDSRLQDIEAVMEAFSEEGIAVVGTD